MKNIYAYLILGFLVSFNPVYAHGYWGCESHMKATGLSEEIATNVCDAKDDLTENEWNQFYNFLNQNKNYLAKQKIVADSVVKNNIYAVDDIIRLASQNSENTMECVLKLISTNSAPRFKDTPQAIAIRDQLRLSSFIQELDIVKSCNEYLYKQMCAPKKNFIKSILDILTLPSSAETALLSFLKADQISPNHNKVALSVLKIGGNSEIESLLSILADTAFVSDADANTLVKLFEDGADSQAFDLLSGLDRMFDKFHKRIHLSNFNENDRKTISDTYCMSANPNFEIQSCIVSQDGIDQYGYVVNIYGELRRKNVKKCSEY